MRLIRAGKGDGWLRGFVSGGGAGDAEGDGGGADGGGGGLVVKGMSASKQQEILQQFKVRLVQGGEVQEYTALSVEVGAVGPSPSPSHWYFPK